MRCLLVASCFALLASSSFAQDAKEPQVIILKLDDVTAHGASGGRPVSARWQKTAEYIEKNNLKAGFGIIGFSLEKDNPAYFQWIKDWQKKGCIEFWNHGYRDRKKEDPLGEFEDSFEVQKKALDRTQQLAREKLGFELRAFGPHYSGTNADTTKAIADVPDIAMWFYGDPKSGKFIFERVLVLENPIFVPDPVKFQQIYESKAASKPVLALQGHPNQWDDKRWEGFVAIIEFLKSKGCVFMTPSEYMAKATAK